MDPFGVMYKEDTDVLMAASAKEEVFLSGEELLV